MYHDLAKCLAGLHFFCGGSAAAAKTLNLARVAGRVELDFCSLARVARVVDTVVAGHGPRTVERNSGPRGAIQGPR